MLGLLKNFSARKTVVFDVFNNTFPILVVKLVRIPEINDLAGFGNVFECRLVFAVVTQKHPYTALYTLGYKQHCLVCTVWTYTVFLT